jgi:hypothetical protein
LIEQKDISAFDDKPEMRHFLTQINTLQTNFSKFTNQNKLASQNSSEDEDEIDVYSKRTYVCLDGLDEEVRHNVVNTSSEAYKDLMDGMYRDEYDFQFFYQKKSLLYEISAMSYASPKSVT